MKRTISLVTRNKPLSVSQKKSIKSRTLDSTLNSFRIEGISFSKKQISTVQSRLHSAK